MVTIVISVFIILTIILMFIVIVVFLIVVRRHRSTSGPPSHRGRHPRRRRSASASTAPDYDAPYIVYGPPGPNGERQLRLVGLDDAQPTLIDPASLPAFKGTLVQPPPYPDEPPPEFAPNVARSSADNHGFEEDRAEDESATSPDAGRSTRNNAD